MEREQEGNDNSGDEEGIGVDEVEEDGALAETAEADCLVGLNMDDVVVCPQPLPILTEGKEEVRALAEEQRLDDSLSEERNKAVKLEDGYMIDKHGVIAQVKVVAPSREVKRLCVPVNRRRDLLEVAHKGLVGGHFSHNKMSVCLLLNYIWPGLRTEVKKYCAACPDCQRAGRVLPPKFPMEKTPIISTPYQRLACDLVGPLPRTKSGFRYLLTVICVGTRYPYAIPLSRVDAVTVAEGLTDILSITGLPKELLTAQGSVFSGALVKQTCELLGIKKLRTTAYHPHTRKMARIS